MAALGGVAIVLDVEAVGHNSTDTRRIGRWQLQTIERSKPFILPSIASR